MAIAGAGFKQEWFMQGGDRVVRVILDGRTWELKWGFVRTEKP